VTRRCTGVVPVKVKLVDDVPVSMLKSFPWLPIAAAAKPAEASSNPKSMDTVNFLTAAPPLVRFNSGRLENSHLVVQLIIGRMS
jgi:hypothetical protein